MIDCPICHVKNNDDARFCAECGQRLASQSSTPSLTEPVQAMQNPPRAAAPAPPQQKLKSPLLSGEDEDYAGSGGGGARGGGNQGSDPGVDRLRQMSNRQAENPAAPERPYKNPYDPRNDPRNQTPENQSPTQPPSGGPQKLRSPLLAGEEFDDDEYEETPPANSRGGGLRSPLLGGGDGGGGGLRSPMLGGGRGQQQYDDDDEPQGGGGGLRSPLLGGGSGGGYAGSDRRRAGDAQYGGQERRRGLRSPILGGGGDDEYYDDYDDEPLDEDNPNVLRSPLLAAKRPLSDRPRNEQSPQGSNMQNPPRQGQMPEVGRNLPNPSSSYTSLKSIRGQGQAPPGPAPQTVPPVPTEPVPPQYQQRPYQPQSGVPTAPVPGPAAPQQTPGPGPSAPQQSQPPQQAAAPPSAGPPTGPPTGAPGGPPTNVPASFSRGYNDPTATSPPMPTVNTAQPVRPAEMPGFDRTPAPATDGGIKVQPPISGPTPAIEKPSTATGGRRRPGMLSAYDGDDEEESDLPARGSSFGARMPMHDAGPPSPLPKIIGAIAMILFIVKAWSFMSGFMACDWKSTGWLLFDQLVMMGLCLAVAVLAFTRRD